MNYTSFGQFGMMGSASGVFGSFLLLAIAWSLLWKGLALWRAAKRGDTWWFVAFLIINTLGILEIIYLFAITGAKLSDFTGAKNDKVEHHNHDHTHKQG
jgi:hypothetical protein